MRLRMISLQWLVVIVAALTMLAIPLSAAVEESADLSPHVCGDVNGSGTVTLADLTYLWNYMFKEGPPPPYPGNADLDGCAGVNTSDLVYLSNYLFLGGGAPCGTSCEIRRGLNWVRLDCGITFPPSGVDSIGLPVFVTNDTTLAAISIGLSYTCNEDYEVSSVSSSGILGGSMFAARIKPDVNQVLIGWLDADGSHPFASHVTEVQIATIWIRVNGGIVKTDCIDFRRAFVNPAGPLIFSPRSGGIITPVYTDCAQPELRPGGGCDYTNPQFLYYQRWSFLNDEESIWPGSEWESIDYCANGTPCARCCILCQAADYPSWELFEASVSSSHCYFDPPPGNVVFRPSALAEWSAIKGPWNGSCFGFAASEALIVDSLLQVDTIFQTITELGAAVSTERSRDLINVLNIAQFGDKVQKKFAARISSIDPATTLDDVQEMLIRNTADADQVLMMFDQLGTGAHVVFPYYMQSNDGGHTWRIYVYDSNLPGDITQFVTITLGAGSHWTYSGIPGWGGSSGLFMLDSIGSCVAPVALEDTSEFGGDIHFYFGEADSAHFSSSEGQIGFNGSTSYSTIEGALTILPLNGQTSQPIGFLLPTNEWYFEAVGVADGVFTIMDGARRIFRVGGAKSGIISAPVVAQSSLTVYGDQVGSKSHGKGVCDTNFIEVIAVALDSEIVVSVSDIVPIGNDSLMFTANDSGSIVISNYGETKVYDLKIEIVNAARDTSFYHSNIQLEQGCSHQIDSDWRTTGGHVVIHCDEGMNGNIDSTFVVTNSPSPSYKCGDADGNSMVTISDAVFLINYIFSGGIAPHPISAGDSDCNGLVTISDVVYLINYIFAGGPSPCALCP